MESNTRPRLLDPVLPRDHCLSPRSSTNVLNLDTNELLDELDVLPSSLGQVVE